jgi:hypothetical protein
VFGGGRVRCIQREIEVKIKSVTFPSPQTSIVSSVLHISHYNTVVEAVVEAVVVVVVAVHAAAVAPAPVVVVAARAAAVAPAPVVVVVRHDGVAAVVAAAADMDTALSIIKIRGIGVCQ